MSQSEDLNRIMLFLFERLAFEEKPCEGITGVTSYMQEIVRIANNNSWELSQEEVVAIHKMAKTYLNFCVIIQDREFLRQKVEERGSTV